jgi:aminodeoxyfutalosine synthase
MAGSEEQNPSMNTGDLVRLIKSVNKRPVERDTLYNVIRDYTHESFEEPEIRGYLQLPVIES